MQTRNFFGIHHTLEGDISHAYIKCLASAYARLKETMRHRYSIVSVQTLLRTLVIPVCGYNPLCSQIPTTKFLTFDRALHFKYIAATKHTITQPAHTIPLTYSTAGTCSRTRCSLELPRSNTTRTTTSSASSDDLPA